MMRAVTRVYVVDDEPLALGAWRRILRRPEFDVATFAAAEPALAALAGDAEVDVVVTDLAMPAMNGMELLAELRRRRPEIEVILITAHGGIDTAIQAVKGGAYHFLTKPFPDLETPVLLVRQAAEHKRLLGRARRLEAELEKREALAGAPALAFVGTSPGMREVRRLVGAAAPTGASVLILGESGTGKELVARAIHVGSPRRGKPFVSVNCSALAETLLESELFGHVRGAFTGAEAGRDGLFVAADGGTLLLDEIGDAPPSVQTKLLRVLQEGEVKPVGANKVVRVDVRLIAATNVDLEGAVRASRFREDLYYRLNVVGVRVPPLRERHGDIGPLAAHFLAGYGVQLGRVIKEISPEALAALEAWTWPGNVRELENAMERAVVLGRSGRLELGDLPDAVVKGTQRGAGAPLLAPPPGQTLPYNEARERALVAFDKTYLEGVLAQTGGNISQAARLAGLDRSNFKRALRRVGGEPDGEGEGE